MATRLYLPSSGSTDITPATDTFWDDSSILERHPCSTSKISSTMTTKSYADSDATDQDIVFCQYISDPLAAQSISAQSVVFRIRAKERATSCNMFTSILIKLVNHDGTIERGYIIGSSTRRDNNEASATALTNRNNTGTSTAITAYQGDRLVIEIGMSGDPAAGSDHDSDISIGDDSGTDLGANDTDTSAFNPYVEFANTLTFYTGTLYTADVDTGTTSPGSSVTISNFKVVGTNTAIVALISSGDSTSGDRQVSTVKFNTSESFTKIDSHENGAYERSEVWALFGATVTSASVVVTMGGTADNVAVQLFAFENAQQSVDSHNGATATSANPMQVSLTTTVADGCFIASIVNAVNFGSNTPSAGQVQTLSVFSGFIVASGSGPKSPAGSVTHGYSSGSSDDGELVIIAIAPYSAATTSLKDMVKTGIIPYNR